MSVYKNQNTATRWTPSLKKRLITWLDDSITNGQPRSKQEICIYIKISERTLTDWCNQHEDFREIYECHLVHRKNWEIQRFISGQTNYKYFQFVMRFCYGEIEAAKQASLALHEKELNHRIANPYLQNSDPIKFEFTVKQPSPSVDIVDIEAE